ncbi:MULTISPECIES: hypothetical protein [unclassified Spirosoma]|uniref:hypothetical protein n=1 Tax=unclassified Spirosoma TaxID=2621999 RepID=UPI0009661CC5|nr:MULTISPECIES: hypothetical protein [unclassified Spirosoma]MBN8826963.1 hypothetical protein [Spirosoma sp.]OJW70685.1 MAG: hypothetical protein BGO59_31860 [Spirosoma sp. 48-14]
MKTLLLLSLLNISTMAIGQQRTTTPVGRKSSSSAVKPTPKSSLQASPSAQPAQSRQQPAPATRQAPYDTYQADRTNVTVIDREKRYDYRSVIKLNFMGLILGGVNLDVEKRIAPKTSVILTGGIYPYGVLKGSYRVGLDFRQYLGESYVPKGLFVSAGGLYHFIPYDNNTTSAGLVNLRALIGYQFVTGHFTFEVAGGPAYGLIITDSKNLSDDQTRISVGLLPAFKASIGYAF